MYPLAPVVFDYFRVPQGQGLPIPVDLTYGWSPVAAASFF
jgi:hypothetical protein